MVGPGAAIGTQVTSVCFSSGRIHAAPYHHQFDANLGRLVKKRLWQGNRHPLQRIKRLGLSRFIRKNIETETAESRTSVRSL